MTEPAARTPAMTRWLAPTTSSRVDHVELSAIDPGWEPERTGESPIEPALAAIRAVGVLEPVLLRPRGDRYELVTGHRTLRAARAAGLGRLPAVVREMGDAAALMALALDGSASGSISDGGRVEFARRLHGSGVPADEVEDLLAALQAAPVTAPRQRRPAAPGPAPVVAETPPAPAGSGHRWTPLPGGPPLLSGVSSAFVDVPRLLAVLAAEGFTGTVELRGPDRRDDVVIFIAGRCYATVVEENGSQVERELRLPAPGRLPELEVTTRPQPPPVAAGLVMALRMPPRLQGLHASFFHLDRLLAVLGGDRADGACVVTAPRGSGVILLAAGAPVAAYARRPGERPGSEPEGLEVEPVAELLALGAGEVDVHDGPLPPPLPLEGLIEDATGR